MPHATQMVVESLEPVVTASGELPAVAAVPRASIVVVPFVNLTGDTGKEYFSDGMAEEKQYGPSDDCDLRGDVPVCR